MMKQIYYRRKGKAMVIEGRSNQKPILIWTLPDPKELLEALMEKSSYFSQEKSEKINQKLKRLDPSPGRPSKVSPKVLIPVIKRTPENDEVVLDESMKEKLWEISQ